MSTRVVRVRFGFNVRVTVEEKEHEWVACTDPFAITVYGGSLDEVRTRAHHALTSLLDAASARDDVIDYLERHGVAGSSTCRSVARVCQVPLPKKQGT